MSGIVFSIQPYSLHDGHGIRTVVFLKGCPLRCFWCSNPESQHSEPQVFFNREKCISDKDCELCRSVCLHGAADNGIDFSRCVNCGICAEICPSKAIGIYGKKMTAEEVIDRAEREEAFYRHGGGGITLSGGEPFMQAEFSIEILQEAKRRGINTAAETCGCCDNDVMRSAAELLNYIFYDIKILDDERHKKYTGCSNKLILENLEMLFKEYPKLHKHIRTPVIPGVNDNEKDISEIRKYLSGKENYTYELLPYHRFGQGKYAMLGRRYPDIPEKLDEELFENLKRL